MKASTQVWVYSFTYSYFENFKNTVKQAAKGAGAFNIFWEDYWLKYRTSNNGYDGGVDIKTFVNNVYDGSQPVCLTDKIAREIGKAVYDTLNAVGLGDAGCAIGKAINDVIDSFTNIVGTFICTATITTLDNECGQVLLDLFKKYRDDEVLTTKKGIRIVKYYSIIGPRIVQAIDEDPNKEEVYQYIYDKYLLHLKEAVDSKNKPLVFEIYFLLMQDMLEKYNIKASKEFRKWLKEYTSSGL